MAGTLKIGTITTPSGSGTITIPSGVTLNAVDGVSGVANTPMFKASTTSAQSFATSTETKIQYNTENIDTASAYDNATNYRFTVPAGQGGKYFISGSIGIQQSASVANFIIYIKKNTSSYILAGKQGGDANYAITSANGIVELVATDYIEAFLYHEYGSNLNNSTNAYINFFSAYKLIGA